MEIFCIIFVEIFKEKLIKMKKIVDNQILDFIQILDDKGWSATK